MATLMLSVEWLDGSLPQKTCKRQQQRDHPISPDSYAAIAPEQIHHSLPPTSSF
jgi:hypothetical protein